MSCITLWRFCGVLAGFALASPCLADVPPNIVAKGKDATALVVVGDGQASGTAFCIDASGYFITNEHVVSATSGNLYPIGLVVRPWKKQPAGPR